MYKTITEIHNTLTKLEGLSNTSQRRSLQTVFVELGFVQTTHVPQFSVLRQPVHCPQRFLLVRLGPVVADLAGETGVTPGEEGVSASCTMLAAGDFRGEQGVVANWLGITPLG